MVQLLFCTNRLKKKKKKKKKKKFPWKAVMSYSTSTRKKGNDCGVGNLTIQNSET
jgi:hypothetical protein